MTLYTTQNSTLSSVITLTLTDNVYQNFQNNESNVTLSEYYLTDLILMYFVSSSHQLHILLGLSIT